jgi:hypothetical protein
MEKCSDSHRQSLVEKVAPHLASLGIHKNGTWAVQKIIDCAKTSSQCDVIANALKPYAPALLLDQFGNYVIQCCLRLGNGKNQFIFDAMTAKCWELGQGRFGARAMKACLESQYTTKSQQKEVSLSIVQNCVQLCMNSNGSILITWLLDSSQLPGRYRVIAPILLPHLSVLCCHKISSLSILKIISQIVESDAKMIIVDGVFQPKTLKTLLADQQIGVSVITKIIQSLTPEERFIKVTPIIPEINKMPKQGVYKRLFDEISTQSVVKMKEFFPTPFQSPIRGEGFRSAPPSAEEPLPPRYPFPSPNHSPEHTYGYQYGYYQN